MGLVYKARQIKAKRLVALKMIRGGGEVGEHQLERFRIEGEAVARLQHPNIVQVYEIGEYQGRPFFSLEFVDGGNLSGKLKGTPLPARQAAQLMEPLARAMHAAHTRGIIHRDLKPENILLARSDLRDSVELTDKADAAAKFVPKITDFGLAKQLDAVDQSHTQAGTIMGTPSYMAPEQAAGNVEDLGPLADVYSLGAILYETLTGRPPFKGVSMMETLDLVRKEDPIPPSRLVPRLPRDIETICLKCLEKESFKRYRSAEALADDLHRFLNNEPIHARPVRPWERAIKWVRRRPALAGLYIVVFLFLLGGISAALYYREARISKHADVRGLLLEVEKAVSQEQFQQAKGLLEGVRHELEGETSWTDLRDNADRLAAEIGQGLERQGQALERQRQASANQARKEQATQKFAKFSELYQRALFNSSLATGQRVHIYRKPAEDAARDALRLYGVTEGGSSPPFVPDPDLGEDERKRLRTGCYELLVLLAEAVAQDPAGDRKQQAQRALDWLARAENLAPRLAGKAQLRRRARYLAQAGKTREAQAVEKQAAATQPRTALDHFLVGDQHFRDQNPEKAMASFESVLKEQPKHFWARYSHATCSIQLNRLELARDNLSLCLIDQPAFYWAYLLRGFAQGKLGDFPAAEEDFRKAKANLPPKTDPEAEYALWVNRGVVRSHQRNRAKDAEGDLKKAIELDGNRYEAHLSLAQLLHQHKRLDDALEHLTKAIEAVERPAEHRDPDPELLAQMYRQRARIHVERGELSAAQGDFEHATLTKRVGIKEISLARGHAGQGHVLLRENKPDEALKAFDAALAIRPDYPEAYLGRARALFAQKDYAGALRAFDRYLALGNSVLLVQGHRQAVRRAFDQWTAAVKTRTDPGQLLAYVASPSLELKEFGETWSAFEEYQKTAGPLAGVYQARAMCKEKLLDPQGATADYTRALEIEPGNADLLVRRGWSYLAADAARLAQPDFEVALRASPNNASALLGRGTVLVRLGPYQEAVEDAQRGSARVLAELAEPGGAHPRGLREAFLLLRAAGIYATASEKVDADPAIPLNRKANLARNYEDRAVDLLRRSVALAGDQAAEFWRDHVRRDADLRPLRKHATYSRLEADMARQGKGKGKKDVRGPN